MFLITAVSCRTFTWSNALIGYLVYAIPGIFGITLCYHRMLTHRSFKTFKYVGTDQELHHALLEHNGKQIGNASPLLAAIVAVVTPSQAKQLLALSPCSLMQRTSTSHRKA